MLESFLNKVSGLKVWNFIKKKLQHRCFPVKLMKFFRTPFLQNISGGRFWKYAEIERYLIVFPFFITMI